MLKLPRSPDEQRGSRLLQWWGGDGAARALHMEADGTALAIERACGPQALSVWSLQGRDDDATTVLCDVIARLHAARPTAMPQWLRPLDAWFEALGPAARTHGGSLQQAHAIARELLAEPHTPVALHGDLHHDNVLDFGDARGWLAIDPQGLMGGRGFDYANLFSNPQLPWQAISVVALQPGVFERRLERVAQASGLACSELLRWIAAYSGLSAAWILDDGDDASLDLGIAARALNLLAP